jgi:hypothetical protein
VAEHFVEVDHFLQAVEHFVEADHCFLQAVEHFVEYFEPMVGQPVRILPLPLLGIV